MMSGSGTRPTVARSNVTTARGVHVTTRTSVERHAT